MQFSTLEELFSHPSFISILFAILVVIGNIMIGVSILPKDRRKRGYKFHRWVYLLSVCVYIYFLIANHYLLGDFLLAWFVLLYFLIVIPLSRKLNITLHAIMASVGLVLLILVAAFNVL